MPDSEAIRKWNAVRAAFATSIMVDTALSSLAENLEGAAWPGSNKVDTPADYIDLEYADVEAEFAARHYPPGTMAALIGILEETLAFDDPFGDMVEHSDAAAATVNPLLENLAKLQIPADFPIRWTGLDADTQEFCRLEKLETVGAFAVFAQSMSQNVIVGGDFRSLLNALSHIDEKALARFLPFRPGSKGLHLVEAIGQTVRSLRKTERDALTARGAAPTAATARRVEELARLFATDCAAMSDRIAKGGTLSREVMVLGDPAIEPLVAKLLEPHLPGAVPVRKTGWFGRLFGR